MLPPLDPTTGQLPPGRHPATWSELEATFVTNAPHPTLRAASYRALREWAGACRQLLPNARFWVDGSFVTHMADAPFDVDVVAITTAAELEQVATQVSQELAAYDAASAAGRPKPKCPTVVRFWGLWTLQNVEVEIPPANLRRLQPYGGHIDAFFAVEENAAALTMWHDNWSRSKSSHPKGYLEVTG